MDELRRVGLELVMSEPQRFGDTRSPILDEHIRTPRKLLNRFSICSVVEIEDRTPLAALPERKGRLRTQRPSPRRLHPDDVGSIIRQQLCHDGAGKAGREVENAQPSESGRHGSDLTRRKRGRTTPASGSSQQRSSSISTWTSPGPTPTTLLDQSGTRRIVELDDHDVIGHFLDDLRGRWMNDIRVTENTTTPRYCDPFVLGTATTPAALHWRKAELTTAATLLKSELTPLAIFPERARAIVGVES